LPKTVLFLIYVISSGFEGGRGGEHVDRATVKHITTYVALNTKLTEQKNPTKIHHYSSHSKLPVNTVRQHNN
jgi:hypothetical protein